MDISELGGPGDGIGAPGRGDLVKAGAVVAVGDPDGLAIGEAGGGREAHRIGCGLLWNSTGSGVGGQYPNHTRNSPVSTGPNFAVTP